MKKQWIAACGFSAFFLSAGLALWMEKPALTQMASNMITTTANSKLNDWVLFSRYILDRPSRIGKTGH